MINFGAHQEIFGMPKNSRRSCWRDIFEFPSGIIIGTVWRGLQRNPAPFKISVYFSQFFIFYFLLILWDQYTTQYPTIDKADELNVVNTVTHSIIDATPCRLFYYYNNAKCYNRQAVISTKPFKPNITKYITYMKTKLYRRYIHMNIWIHMNKTSNSSYTRFSLIKPHEWVLDC